MRHVLGIATQMASLGIVVLACTPLISLSSLSSSQFLLFPLPCLLQLLLLLLLLLLLELELPPLTVSRVSFFSSETLFVLLIISLSRKDADGCFVLTLSSYDLNSSCDCKCKCDGMG